MSSDWDWTASDLEEHRIPAHNMANHSQGPVVQSYGPGRNTILPVWTTAST